MSIILNKIKSNFKNKSLWNEALTHKSASSRNYERLEYLGDSIIGFFIAEKLFKSFSELNEGELQQIRSSLVSRSILNDLGQKIGLSKEIILGKGVSTENNSIVGDVLEALVGAIFIDRGFEQAKDFLEKVFLDELDSLDPSVSFKDAKSILQEILHKKSLSLPIYKSIDRGDTLLEDRFECRCYVEELNLTSTGLGKSKKSAEQHAAQLLLDEYFKND